MIPVDRPVAGDASCPHAAAAEQFLQNSWAGWFLPEAASDVAAQHSALLMGRDVSQHVAPAAVGFVDSHQLAATVTKGESSERPGRLQHWQHEKESLPGPQPDVNSLGVMDDLVRKASNGSSSSSSDCNDTDPAAVGTELAGHSPLSALLDSNGRVPLPDNLQQQAQALMASTPEAGIQWEPREQKVAAQEVPLRPAET